MTYGFYKNHICFFLSVFIKTNTLHLYSMCSGIKTLKQCFPNCVPRHIGVPLKKLKCAAKVLCFDKTLYFSS